MKQQQRIGLKEIGRNCDLFMHINLLHETWKSSIDDDENAMWCLLLETFPFFPFISFSNSTNFNCVSKKNSSDVIGNQIHVNVVKNSHQQKSFFLNYLSLSLGWQTNKYERVLVCSRCSCQFWKREWHEFMSQIGCIGKRDMKFHTSRGNRAAQKLDNNKKKNQKWVNGTSDTIFD